MTGYCSAGAPEMKYLRKWAAAGPQLGLETLGRAACPDVQPQDLAWPTLCTRSPPCAHGAHAVHTEPTLCTRSASARRPRLLPPEPEASQAPKPPEAADITLLWRRLGLAPEHTHVGEGLP